MKNVCINLDWLEVYCLEPVDAPRDFNYFKSRGYIVEPRAYGTPQYAQMFTLYESDDDFIEIRRDPYSLKSQGGVFLPGACHLRLCNRTCYERDPIGHLRMFLITHGYQLQNISRIDIALDFVDFDAPDVTPRDFVARYMRSEISKVCQSNVAAHGYDYWANRIWNSLKWGSPSSPVTTKLYNKTLELRQQQDKSYIRTRWLEAGFSPAAEVWRIEFSCSSQAQTLKSKVTGQTFVKSLSSYDTRDKLMFQFQVLYAKYFDFRRVITNHDGTLKRKYECPRVTLFNFVEAQPYTPVRNIAKSRFVGRTWKILSNKLHDIKFDISLPKPERDAADVLMSLMLRARAEEIAAFKDEQLSEELRLELYRQGISLERIQMEADMRNDREIRLMWALIRKHGIQVQDDTLPF